MIGLRRIFLASVLALAAIPAIAQADIHISADPATGLYQRSSWAHGYIHGYEMGFHNGDLDLHLGRGWRETKQMKDSKKMQYRNEYGDRKVFEKGFKAGFDVGYADALTGKEFRAAKLARETAAKLGGGIEPHQQKELDWALSSGYLKGRDAGLNDGRLKSAYSPEKGACAEQKACDSFLLGYRWGYSDGYQNQRQPDEDRRTARK